MSRLLTLSLLLLLVTPLLQGCAGNSTDAESSDDEETVDHLGLAAILIRDRFYDRARVVLDEVDLKAEGLDVPRYYTLLGLTALGSQDWEGARSALGEAVKRGQSEPMLRVYMAQASYALADYEATLTHLEAAGETAAKSPDAHRMKIHSAWKLERPAQAFQALAQAQARFPKAAEFSKQRVLYLLQLGLYQEAVGAGQDYLKRADNSARAYLALGEALRRSRRHEEAARVLESGRLRFPEDSQMLLALAHAHLDAGRPRSAGDVMEEAARRDPKLLSEAAELHRRGGDLRRALYLNTELADQPVKVRQRLGILLEQGKSAQAVALSSRVSRLGLLDDEDVRYALAYAHFRCEDLDQAAQHLRGITKPALFRAATDLRKAIDAKRKHNAAAD